MANPLGFNTFNQNRETLRQQLARLQAELNARPPSAAFKKTVDAITKDQRLFAAEKADSPSLQS